jgi:hypothetical protein
VDSASGETSSWNRALPFTMRLLIYNLSVSAAFTMVDTYRYLGQYNMYINDWMILQTRYKRDIDSSTERCQANERCIHITSNTSSCSQCYGTWLEGSRCSKIGILYLFGQTIRMQHLG